MQFPKLQKLSPSTKQNKICASDNLDFGIKYHENKIFVTPAIFLTISVRKNQVNEIINAKKSIFLDSKNTV